MRAPCLDLDDSADVRRPMSCAWRTASARPGSGVPFDGGSPGALAAARVWAVGTGGARDGASLVAPASGNRRVGLVLRSDGRWTGTRGDADSATEAGRRDRLRLLMLGADEVISLIRPENTASIKVAERLEETYHRTPTSRAWRARLPQNGDPSALAIEPRVLGPAGILLNHDLESAAYPQRLIEALKT